MKLKLLGIVTLIGLFSANTVLAKTLGEEADEIIRELDHIDNYKSSWWGHNRDWSETNGRARSLETRLSQIAEQLKTASPSTQIGEERLVVDHYHQIAGSVNKSHDLYTYSLVVAESEGALLVAMRGDKNSLRVTSSHHSIRLQEYKIDPADQVIDSKLYLAKSSATGDLFWVKPTHMRPTNYDSGVHDADKMVVYRDSNGTTEVAFLNSRSGIFTFEPPRSVQKVIIAKNGKWILGTISKEYRTHSGQYAWFIDLEDGTSVTRVVNPKQHHPNFFSNITITTNRYEVFLIKESGALGQQIFWPKYSEEFYFKLNKRKVIADLTEGLINGVRGSTFSSDRVKLEVSTTSSEIPVIYYLTERGVMVRKEDTKNKLEKHERAVTASADMCSRALQGLKASAQLGRDLLRRY